jgi:prepilin-type N-terminal cleavage/methylation domain-containing protein
MLLWRVRKSNFGFTLVEMLAVVIIIGVIAAIAAPNLLGLLNRNQVNEAMRQLEGALKEAQKQAIRTGKQCSIDIDTTNHALSNPTGGGCLLSTRNFNDLIELDSNLVTLTFSGKGNTIVDPNNRPVLVVSIPNSTNIKKCVVIENFLGAIRTGEYTGSGTDATNCVSTPN